MSSTQVSIRLAHSPDADDLVMWWPLVGLDWSPGSEPEPAIDTGPFRFDLVARDVEELNKIVVAGGRSDTAYDVTAISAGAYPAVRDAYAITRCGASFGEGYGPRVVVREDHAARVADDLRGTRIAVPGVNTTAFLVLTLMLGGSATDRGFEPVEMLFSEIPGAVARGEVDAGLLIHEAQLTFADMGLRKLADLGEWWGSQGEDATQFPLPLGLNVVRRDLDQRFGQGTVSVLSRVLSASVRHAVEQKADSIAYLRANKGTRTEWDDDALLDEYLAMYVSQLTLDMGGRGVRALRDLLGRGHERGLCPDPGGIDIV